MADITNLSALSAAKYIIAYCNKYSISISNLKLQKILYLMQAEFLIAIKHPCFIDAIEAWDFGPVIPDVYYHYRVFGAGTIPYLDDLEYCPFTENEKAIADDIINTCASYSSAELNNMIHKQTPWIDAFHADDHTITNDSLVKFFQEP